MSIRNNQVLYSTLKLSFKFDAAHCLPNYKGDCSRMHGHTWKFDISLNGRVDPTQRMVLDFKLAKQIVNRTVLDRLDHQVLNKAVPELYPTAEELAYWIYCQLYNNFLEYGVTLTQVEVFESDGASATFLPIGGV